jgi:hypothetical protein
MLESSSSGWATIGLPRVSVHVDRSQASAPQATLATEGMSKLFVPQRETGKWKQEDEGPKSPSGYSCFHSPV